LDLETEVFIKVRAWKNYDDLEDSLSLPELDTLLLAIREDEKETKVFQAAMQGVDLSKHINNPVEDKRREIERRAAERIAGGMDAVERQEFAEFGITFETDDD
jgi:flagellar biosynthesis chaperone FliJ